MTSWMPSMRAERGASVCGNCRFWNRIKGTMGKCTCEARIAQSVQLFGRMPEFQAATYECEHHHS